MFVKLHVNIDINVDLLGKQHFLLQAEKFHTHLAVLYLENILRKQKEENDEVLKLRRKLRHLLQFSNLYRVQLLLSKMNDADLHQETAILYGKVCKPRKREI